MSASLTLPLFSHSLLTTSVDKLYNVVGDLLDVSTRKNPLYYANHFQFRHGSLYRAILGRQGVWDKDWEERLIKCLDRLYHDLIDKGHYSLECYRSLAIWTLKIRGRLWVNEVPVEKLTSGEAATIAIPPRTHIYARVDGDRVDIEGSQLYTKKEIVISVERDFWEKIQGTFEVVDAKSRANRNHQKNNEAMSAVPKGPRAEAD